MNFWNGTIIRSEKYHQLSSNKAVHQFPQKIINYYFLKGPKIKKRTLSRAVSIIERAKREGATSGSDPFSAAAIATYLACRAENEKVTQDEIGKVFGVSPVTIRNNAKKLNKFIKTE